MPLSKIQLIQKYVLNSDFTASFEKSLWRITRGNRDAAYKIIRSVANDHYDFKVDDADIDDALAEMNGGCEIEWLS